jgi:Cu/Ag efflux protein CusF
VADPVRVSETPRSSAPIGQVDYLKARFEKSIVGLGKIEHVADHLGHALIFLQTGSMPNIERMQMKSMLSNWVLGLSLALVPPAWADTQHASHSGTEHAAMLTEGVVKKVDKAQGKLTIKHGPLENLGMPAMTMVFRVQDAGWLEQVKHGDNVRFLADRVNGVFTVTTLEVVKP